MKNKAEEPVPTEILVKLQPEQIRFIVAGLEKAGAPNKTRWPAVLNLGLSASASIVAWVVLMNVASEVESTASQYFANLAAGGLLFAGGAALARAIHAAFPDMRFDVSEKVMIASAAIWLAITTFAQISVLGTASGHGA